MGETGIAVLFALPFSILIVAIEITRLTSFPWAGVFRGSTLLYFLIAYAGNVFTTVLVAATASRHVPDTAPPWFWYAFLGVFGFEAILKRTNLTFAGIGVLSISDWITKAKDSATANIIEAEVMMKEQSAQHLASRLKELSDSELNAHVINVLGHEHLTVLNTQAAQGNADAKLIKALALAKGNYKAAAAIFPR